MAANDRGPGSKKATGRAFTLLNGIVRCGRCGRPTAVRNARVSANPRYTSDSGFREYGGPRCQSLVAAYPDRLIESLVLKAVEPASCNSKCLDSRDRRSMITVTPRSPVAIGGLAILNRSSSSISRATSKFSLSAARSVAAHFNRTRSSRDLSKTSPSQSTRVCRFADEIG